MSHDERVYHEPEVFKPERFLISEYGTKDNVDNFGRRHDLAFGSGRVRVLVFR
jgi:cytochrome P450